MNAQSVHLYIVDLKNYQPPAAAECAAALPESEWAMARNFATPILQTNALTTRFLTRSILSKYLSLTPRDIPMNRDDLTKPTLGGAFTHLHFNISHTQEYFVLALTENALIGIDVENIERKIDIFNIAKRFFHHEEYQALLNAQHPTDTFFRIWTQKEAFVKAIGEGISFGLEKFCVDPINPQVIAIENNHYHAEDFHSYLSILPKQHCLALTANKSLKDLSIFHY